MTTIAYRDGILAADGRTTYGDTIFTDNSRKIHRLSDGALFALCGDVSYVQPMLDALEDDEVELPKVERRLRLHGCHRREGWQAAALRGARRLYSP
jgi:ATP-dependent protease HslVU (ClpYQ) peptidase subunit